MPPVKKKDSSKRKEKEQNVLLFDPPILSSATLNDVNSCYRDSIRDTKEKIRLLNQSISSLIITRRERDAQFMPNEKLITLDGVYEEVNKKIANMREVRKYDPELIHYSSSSEI